jgi:hypothetical protein
MILMIGGEMSSAVQGLFNMADEIREAGEEFAPVYSHEDSVFDPTSADWWAKSVTNIWPYYWYDDWVLWVLVDLLSLELKL